MSAALGALLAGGADDERPFLHFAARTWSRRQLLGQADALAGDLRRRGLPLGAVLGIALPNLSATVVALLAALRGGFVAAPVDPRQPVDALLRWQATCRPLALVTLDLATVFERTRPLLEDPALRLLPVARMADELALLPRLLAPWLRNGGTLRRLADSRAFFWLRDLATGAAVAPLPLRLPDGGTLDGDELAAAAPRGDRALLGLPLAAPAALLALCGAWAGGGALLLSPRLDARALAKAAKQGQAATTISP